MEKERYRIKELKKLVRMEDLGSDIWNPSTPSWLCYEGTYEVTLQDMQAALLTIFEKKVSLRDVLTWHRCLDYYVTKALEPKDIIRLKCKETCPLHEFPSDERGVLNRVWRMLFYYIDDLEDELEDIIQEIEEEGSEIENTTEYLPNVFHDAMILIDCFYQNQALPKEQWTYPRFMKRALLARYEDGRALANATDEEKAKFVKWVDELAAENDGMALHIRCYGRYTGNAVYEQDFYSARDDAERLLEMTENPEYANTLGYIYYYGRVNGGEPEYDKALQHFMYGAANGVHESIFKLADMYRNGYGVRKSEVTAYRMIAKLYDELFDQYKKGDDAGSFADVALRRGSMILHANEDPETEPWLALEYLLPAEYAIQERLQLYHFYGDEVVASHIKRCLAEVKQLIPPRKNIGKYGAWQFWPVRELCEDDYKVAWNTRPLKNGNWSITFRRIEKRFEDEPDKTFFVIPELYYCTFADSVRGRVTPLGKDMPSQGMMDWLEFEYDDHGDEVTVLYYDDEPVLVLKGWVFDWRIKKPKKASGRTVRMVSIAFSENGRLYDYRCDLDDVKIGDRVVVDGYEGETEVVVRDVRDVAEEELNLPLDRYKMIKRFA